MTTLHLGTRNVDAVKEVLPGNVDVFVELYGWEVWGEGADPDPHHVIVRTRPGDDSTDLLNDVSYLLAEAPGLLIPMMQIHQAGVLAVLTPDDDWSQPYYTLVDDQARIQALKACPHPADEQLRVPSRGRRTYHGKLMSRRYCQACHTSYPVEVA